MTVDVCDPVADYEYVGTCCHVWPLFLGYPVGRCGFCGEVPSTEIRPIKEGP